MATPTTLYSGWTQVAFTPSGGTAIAINRVSSIDYDPGGALTPYLGDTNRYPVALINFHNHPRMTVHSENVGTLVAINPGAVGSLVAVLNDARNGDALGSGALKYTLANSVVENSPGGGQHGHYARGSVTFKAYSTDGVTSPLSVTVL